MQVFISSPYRPDKNLGLAYNEFMRLLPDDAWGCLTDIDVLFLTPDAGVILHEYAKQNHDAGLLTCFTNRVSNLSTKQLLGGRVSEDRDVRNHVLIAEECRNNLYTTSEILGDISGFLMLISKRSWKETPFDETGKCLGVDTYYARKLHAAGKAILRMNGLYVFHTYRMKNGVHDKTHLK